MIAVFLYLIDVSGSEDTSSAVATCVQIMPRLRTLHMDWLNPLPVLQSLSHRGSPLDSVRADRPPWVCTLYTYSYATFLRLSCNGGLLCNHSKGRSLVDNTPDYMVQRPIVIVSNTCPSMPRSLIHHLQSLSVFGLYY